MTEETGSGNHSKRISDRQFDATYIALQFDQNRNFVGTRKTQIRITQGPGDNGA